MISFTIDYIPYKSKKVVLQVTLHFYQSHVKVRPFLSAKTIDMVDYIKPTQRDFNPDVYLLHVGTNDLSSNKSPEQTSLDILNLANSLKLDNNTVIVSGIVPRDDENK